MSGLQARGQVWRRQSPPEQQKIERRRLVLGDDRDAGMSLAAVMRLVVEEMQQDVRQDLLVSSISGPRSMRRRCLRRKRLSRSASSAQPIKLRL
jgi:hypothetical protein